MTFSARRRLLCQISNGRCIERKKTTDLKTDQPFTNLDYHSFFLVLCEIFRANVNAAGECRMSVDYCGLVSI